MNDIRALSGQCLANTKAKNEAENNAFSHCTPVNWTKQKWRFKAKIMKEFNIPTVITWSASISHAINSVERRREYKCVKQMEKRKQTTVSDNAFVACDVSSVAFYSFAVLFDHFKRRENTYEISLSRIAHTRTIARTSINKRSRIRNASTGDNELLFQLTTIARVVKFNVKSKDNLVVRIVHPFNWRHIFLFFVIFSTWLWLSVSVLPI